MNPFDRTIIPTLGNSLICGRATTAALRCRGLDCGDVPFVLSRESFNKLRILDYDASTKLTINPARADVTLASSKASSMAATKGSSRKSQRLK
jgi:hypothetical protein